MEKTVEKSSTPQKNSIFHKILFLVTFSIITWFMLTLLIDTATNIYTAIRLKHHGLTAIATINEYNPRREHVGKFWSRFSQIETQHIHTITYDKFSNDIELKQMHPLNTRISVIYDKDNPNRVWVNTIPATIWSLLSLNMKISGFSIGDIINVFVYIGISIASFCILVKTYFKYF